MNTTRLTRLLLAVLLVLATVFSAGCSTTKGEPFMGNAVSGGA